MASCVMRKLVNSRQLFVNRGIILRCYSLWTPDYLELMKPKIPQCPVINVRMRGYDYPILENYQKLVHIIAENMDLDVENSYAVPAKDLKIVKFKPLSTVAESEYKLHFYERNTQISEIPAPKLPILVRMLEAALPEGVTLDVGEHNPEKEQIRYVPDKQLLDLKAELETFAKPPKK